MKILFGKISPLFATFLGFTLIFLLLLFKDPFSERTLIPNFEPYPDAIYYVNPARSLLSGEGLYITREGRKSNPVIAPLYSLSIAPLFLINYDARMFYFTNLILALFSWVFFYLIIKKLIKSFLITVFGLFLYITNYFIYWQPNLAMAENLLLMVFLGTVLIFVYQIKPRYFFLGGVLMMSFYATKYAAASLTAVSLLFFMVKAWLSGKTKKIKIENLIYLGIGFLLSLTAYSVFEYYQGNNMINSIFGLFRNFFPSGTVNNFGNPVVPAAAPWFSLKYIAVNLPHYLNAIRGGSERFLWDFTPLVPQFVGIFGVVGLIFGITTKQYRLISAMLLGTVVASVIFMSTFYSVDMRYIYYIIPVLIIGFVLFFELCTERLHSKYLKTSAIFLAVLLFVFYAGSSAIRLKKQIMLNLKYAETPWYYISVLELNKYFTPDKIYNTKKPIVISPMPPYYIDFFSNGNYSLLPISVNQEFRSRKEAAWGPNDYSDLTKLYTKYINSGYHLYLGKYGLGNDAVMHAGFDNIDENFKITIVQTGCYSQCDIYKVELKNE